MEKTFWIAISIASISMTIWRIYALQDTNPNVAIERILLTTSIFGFAAALVVSTTEIAHEAFQMLKSLIKKIPYD